MSQSESTCDVAPAPRRFGPKPKSLGERAYTARKPITRPIVTRSKRTKEEVIMFLMHHKVYDLNTPRSVDGYRKPTQAEAAAYFKIPQSTISTWWANRESFLNPKPKTPKPKRTKKPKGSNQPPADATEPADMAEPAERRIWQPIHPDIRDKLDPQYVEYHDNHLQYIEPEELTPWSRQKKSAVPLPPGGTEPLPVGSVQDLDVGHFRVRVLTPTGECEERGWPVLVWFHGGGWVNGNLNSGLDYCTRFCQGARALIVSVDYRLAPENPFPAGVEDAVDAVRWVYSSPSELGNIDLTRVSIGGVSSGGNLAVVAALAAANPETALPSANPSRSSVIPHPPISLFLYIPVIDNTATADDVWKDSAKTAPWLTAERLTHYRQLYLPQAEDSKKWAASPNLAPEPLLRKLPKTWIAVAEFDLLAPEALAFGEQLKSLDVNVETVVVEGGTHFIMSLHGKIDRGQKIIDDGVKHLQTIFGA